MANSNKNLVITPNIGSANDPNIVFSGADASTAAQNITLTAYPTNGGTLSFDGSAGQLFSVTNSMSGTIFSANDVSGIPSLEILDTGLVKIAQYSGNILLGTSTDTGLAKLQIVGSVSLTGNILHSPTGRSIYGPNPTWSSYLYLGGDGVNGITRTASIASIVTTNGNVHIDSGSDKSIYLNYYSGTGGIQFGNGTSAGVTATLSAGGIFTSTADVRAPIFYDSNDTAYYLNPNATSNLNAATFAGTVTAASAAPEIVMIASGGNPILRFGDTTGTVNNRNWKLTSNNSANGDFLIMRSLTTGATAGTVALGFDRDGAATFAGNLSITGERFRVTNESTVLDVSTTTAAGGFVRSYSNKVSILNAAGAAQGVFSSTGLAVTGAVSGARGVFSDSSGSGSAIIEAYSTVATNGTTAIIRQTTGGGNGNQDIGLLVDIQGAADTDRIANFRYYNGSAYTSRMAIMRGGNVGIGTISPDAMLHAVGGIAMSGGWNRTMTLEATYPSLVFKSNASKWAAIMYDYSSALLFRVGATSNDVTGSGVNALSIAAVTGAATFGSTVSATNLSGTNTGDQTNISGNAATATTSDYLTSADIRTISPSSGATSRMRFGFTSWANNNTGPYADYLLLRSYADASGGNDNLLMLNKSSIAMRVYQQTWGSASAYSTYADVLMSNNYNSYAPTLTGTGASGTWGINTTGYSKWIDRVPQYQWLNATLPAGYNSGVETSFVSSAEGWPNYGVVLSVMGRIPADPGGNFQLYMGHGATYGGLGLRVRSINQTGNAWTSWKILLDETNYTSYSMPAGSSATNSVDVRAPIFYDSNNTAYYTDPASTSNLAGLTVGTVKVGGPITDSDASTPVDFIASTRGTTAAGVATNSLYMQDFTATAGSGGAIVFGGNASGGVYRAYAQITASKANGTATDYAGGLVLSTRVGGGNMTAALSISASQAATFAGAVSIAGDLTVGNGTSSRIYMSDTDEGTRQIHCNSNRIGFLDQNANWGAYCDDSGNWFATNLSGTNTGDQTVGNGALTLAVSGTGLSGSASFSANQSGATTFTVTSNATGANTASTIVARDGLGNFSAGTITAGSNAGISIGANQTSKGSLYQSSSGGTILKMAAGSVLGFIVEGTLGQTVFTQALGGTLSINPDGYTTTFGGSVSASNLSGTNTGDQTNISGNAATAYGLNVHTGRNNEANKVVRTDGSGYIQAGWINSDSGDSGFASRLTRITCSTDNYLRYLGLTDFKVSIGESAKNNYSRRIDYGSDVNYHVGSFGHASYGANETFHGGSGFFDIWSGTNYPSGLSHIHGFNALHYTQSSLGTTGGTAYGWQMAAQYNSDTGPWWRRCSGGSFSSWLKLVSYGNNTSGDIYATRYYDSDNTGYYLDPNGTSNLLGLTVTNTISGSVNGSAATATALVTGNNYQVNSLGVGTAASGTAGEIRATNNITAYYSDDRLKTKLGLISDPIEKVKSLSGFYFEANETAVALGYTKQREVGVSAQEVQAILPEIIAPAPIDAQYMTVRYEKLIPLLIEAIKAQQVQIEELKAHITIIQQNLNNK